MINKHTLSLILEAVLDVLPSTAGDSPVLPTIGKLAKTWLNIKANCGFWLNASWILFGGAWEWRIKLATWAAAFDVPDANAAEKNYYINWTKILKK